MSLLANLVLRRPPGGPELGRWAAHNVNCSSMTFFVYANCNDFDTLCLRTKKTSAFQLCLQSEVCFGKKTKGCMSNNSFLFFLQSISASRKMSTFSRRSGYDLVMMLMMLKKVIYQICHSCVCSLLHLATFILYDKSNLSCIICV